MSVKHANRTRVIMRSQICAASQSSTTGRLQHKGGLVLSSIHETAYPRCKPELTQRELEGVSAPSTEDSKFVRKKIGVRSIEARYLREEEERHHSRLRCMEAIRAYAKIKPITDETHATILSAATAAAQNKQELAHIINVIIEELVRQRFELPAFSTLNRKALTVRSEVNGRYFKSLADQARRCRIGRFKPEARKLQQI